jgi:hypothetical protein
VPGLPGKAARSPVSAPRAARLALALAVASTLLYAGALNWLAPEPLGDEGAHLDATRALLRGDTAAVSRLPMLPAYHLAVAPAVWLAENDLAATRLANVAFAALAFIFLALAIRGLAPQAPALTLLLVAWHPLAFPLTAVNYTDTLSLAALSAALAAHVRGARGAAGAALFVAALIRQTNAVWAAFFLAWIVLDALRARPLAPRDWRSRAALIALARRVLPSAWPYLAAPASIALGALWFGRLTLSGAELNGPAFNPAQYYLLTLHVIAWGLPLWLPRLWHSVRTSYPRALANPWRVSAAVAFAGVWTVGFVNPHAWNREFWDLRNAPLLLMQNHVPARVALAVLATVLLPIIVRFYRQQPRRELLGAAWATTGAALAPQFLAEPRYYTFSLVLATLLTAHEPHERRRLLAWHVLACVGLAALPCLTGRQYGGVW